MDEPEYCGVCHQRLQRIVHSVAHGGTFRWNAKIRTCPHNVHGHRFEDPRHDEWHHCEESWVKREFVD